MGKRREGREAAIQFLFQSDLNPAANHEEEIDAFWKLLETTAAVREYADALIRGVLANREAIDTRLKQCVANYELHRIAAVDRNILRLAIYELLHCDDIPPAVIINEAIEIAKRYGSKESGRFVNGVLDRIRADLNRPARQSQPISQPRSQPKPQTPSA